MLRRLLPLALLGLLLPAAAASAKGPTCKAGHTVWSTTTARIFTTTRTYDEGRYHTYWLCSSAIRRPRAVMDDRYASRVFAHWRAYGRHVVFSEHWDDGAEAGWQVGWVDLATGETREREIGGDDPKALAVDGDGAIAFLEAGGVHTSVIGWVPDGVYKLGSPATLTSLDEDVDPASLAFVDGVVSWRTAGGAPGSVRAR
jgi:hypothetical protein